jgi:TPR repeat protein
MFADGEGVHIDKLRAFEYFTRIAREHADEVPGTPRGLMVANAFVALGHYYRDGIPDSPVRADADRARQMFWYAASYFADPEAQYHLGRLYADGKVLPKDSVQAARWFRLAANKGHHLAQATLGAMLFNGNGIGRQAALGLFWLIVAKDSAKADERWINETYETAMAKASDDERAMAYRYLKDWLRTRP